MAEYTIELSDDAVQAIFGWEPQAMPDEPVRLPPKEKIEEWLKSILLDKPDREQRGNAAIEMLRVQAMDRAIQIAAPGASGWDLQRVANSIVDYWLDD